MRRKYLPNPRFCTFFSVKFQTSLWRWQVISFEMSPEVNTHSITTRASALGNSATWYPRNSKPFLETITLQENLETIQWKGALHPSSPRQAQYIFLPTQSTAIFVAHGILFFKTLSTLGAIFWPMRARWTFFSLVSSQYIVLVLKSKSSEPAFFKPGTVSLYLDPSVLIWRMSRPLLKIKEARGSGGRKSNSLGKRKRHFRVSFPESPETFRAHNSLNIFKTKASRGKKLCSYCDLYSLYNMWKTTELYRISGSDLYAWLFGPETFSGLSRNGPRATKLFLSFLTRQTQKSPVFERNTKKFFAHFFIHTLSIPKLSLPFFAINFRSS